MYLELPRYKRKRGKVGRPVKPGNAKLTTTLHHEQIARLKVLGGKGGASKAIRLLLTFYDEVKAAQKAGVQLW